MAAFSSFDQHHTFLLDSTVLLPNTINVNIHDDPNNPCIIPQYYQIEKKHHRNLDQFSTVVMSSPGPSIINDDDHEDSVVSFTNKNSDSSSIVTENKYDIQSCEQVIMTQKIMNNTVMDKKRKSKEGYYANSAQSKHDKREVKEKKQKKTKSNAEEEKKEDPKGYIHVRARRGQATDSHSLAERVRREKISERMKLLQAIVPGCDKVTGKALMLDEIINYVQSLQNQVEFLSMKLACVNPMYYDFGMDLDSFIVRPEQELSNLPSPLASMQEYSPTTAVNYHLLDNSANSLLFQHAQIPNVLLLAGSRQSLWELDELRHRNTNESGIEQQPVFFPLI